MSAAAGGITTVIEHPLTYPPVTTAQLYREKREMAAAKVVVDFGLWGALTAPSIPEIAGQWREGAGGFKAFMPISDPYYPHVTDAEFLDGMHEVQGRSAAWCWCTAESDSLLQAGLARMKAEGGATRSPTTSRDRRSWRRRRCTGRSTSPRTPTCGSRSCTSPARSAPSWCAPRRRGGRPVTMEICPHHLLLDLDDLVRLGPYGCCAPALRDRPLVERLWDYVLDGTADCLISDHSAYTMEEKEPGWEDIFDALLGCQVIQETVPVALDEAFHRRGMPLDAFVRFSSTNPARIAGLHPRKGTLLPGADADIAIYDLDTEWVVDARSQQFSKNPWSPFDGRRVRAGVVRTLVRGETVFADGEIVAAPGSGRFLSCHDDYSLAGGVRGRGELTVFRLALLNPNTDERPHDRDARRRARGAARGLRGDGGHRRRAGRRRSRARSMRRSPRPRWRRWCARCPRTTPT